MHDVASVPLRIAGRSSSHYTRVTRIFAHELGVPHELVPTRLVSLDAEGYAGNPALKLPTLLRPDGSCLFGTENICRAIAELGAPTARVVWPEDLRDDLARNAQEMTWHAMAAQVQLVLGVSVGGLPADHPYFAKGRAGLEGALRWLDAHLDAASRALPAPRDLSLLEVTLFCLVDHLRLRPTVPLEPYPALVRFCDAFAARPSAERTPYRFDAAPSGT